MEKLHQSLPVLRVLCINYREKLGFIESNGNSVDIKSPDNTELFSNYLTNDKIILKYLNDND